MFEDIDGEFHTTKKYVPPNGKASSAHAEEPNGHDGGTSRFPLLRFGELKPGTAPNYLIKGILPRVGLATVWGPPKCGKSFWVFDVALHIALGWKYRGKHTMQSTVVYCAFEGASGFHARAEAFRTEHAEALAELEADVPFYLMPTRLDLVRDHEALISSIEEKVGPRNNPGVVVLDTLNRSLNGSESKDVDMAAYINAADAIRERFSCLVLIVHHCGVDGTRPRGHTSLTGAIDAQLAVKRDNAKQIVTTVEHMKDGAEGETLVSTLTVIDVGTDDDGDKITSCVIKPSDKPPGWSGIGASLKDPVVNALNILKRAIADAGEKPPASNHIPAGVKAVPLTLWREYYMTGTGHEWDKSGDNETARKAFYRAHTKLKKVNMIDIWDGLVWIVGGTSGT
jgi:AAA domain